MTEVCWAEQVSQRQGAWTTKGLQIIIVIVYGLNENENENRRKIKESKMKRRRKRTLDTYSRTTIKTVSSLTIYRKLSKQV